MTKCLFDSSAWVEYFSGSKTGESIGKIIGAGEIITSVIAIAELADKCLRDGHGFESVFQFIGSKAEIVPLSIPIAIRAAKRKNELRRSKSKFGLADGIHLATAEVEGAILITTDSDFAGISGARVFR